MYQNEPFTDFGVEANRNVLEAALAEIERRSTSRRLLAAPIINGTELAHGELVDSIDPSSSATVLGQVRFATTADADRALESLSKGFPAWRDTPYTRRAEILQSAAAIMRRDKAFLTALVIRESGKTWREADADVAEAIDFCTYYAEQMLRLGPPQRMGAVPGEDNQYFYEPRGVAVVVAPWNFPFAIPCGMTVAALVAGNTTVLKPSEQTGLIAFQLAKILLEAGVPPSAFALLPGWGEEVGAALVKDPRVDIICFTGSKAVGLQIIRTAAEVQPGQRNVKKVVAEMGGKNAIIVDDDADLDEVIKGVVQAAFGFAGQKCSACSRLIAVGSVYEPLLARLKEAVGDIIVGEARDPGTFLSPVIDAESHQRILKLIAEYERSHTLVAKGRAGTGGFFVPATVFRDVPVSSPLWREEIFGPVVAACQARDFEHALELANDSAYALTGAIYSRSPAHIAKGRERFRVGNLYINRPCTGALVYRQPFGGAKMSGIGSKAGGPDYLLQFLEPRTVTENTMRRGVAAGS